jgi:hypothetical protein
MPRESNGELVNSSELGSVLRENRPGRDLADVYEFEKELLESPPARTGDGPPLCCSREDEEEPYALDLVRECSRLPPREERG